MEEKIIEQSERLVKIVKLVAYALKSLEGHSRSSQDEQYCTPMWWFTRVIKSYVKDDDKLNPEDVFFVLVAPEITRRGGWGVVDDELTDEDAYLEFVTAWNNVQFKIGETPLDLAYRKSLEARLPMERGDEPVKQGYCRFVGLAGWLQVIMGDCSIMLPCEKTAALFSVSPMTISRYREMAIVDGYLSISRKHSRVERRATEFRFDISKFEELRSAAEEKGR